MEFYLLDHEATYEDIKKFNFPNQRTAVIAHIENENGEILLQQRGIKSRDENGLFEDISGQVETYDENFKAAIIREIKEEIGDNVNLAYSDSIGLYHYYKNNINWIFIIYFFKYIDGVIEIMEPEKCMGYKFFKYEELINSELVTGSSKFLCKSIKDNYVNKKR